MGTLPRRWFTLPLSGLLPAGVDRVTKSQGAKTSPEAVLTYPKRDLQGDLVEPMGIDWHDFNTIYHRLVNLEHGPYIGTARVETKSLPRLNDAGQPDESLDPIALPVGTTEFFKSTADARQYADHLRQYDANGRTIGLYDPDECYQYAEQTYPLVMDGTLSGVSLEFRPAGPEGVAYKSLGKSPMLNRDAFHFLRTKAMGYAAACQLPVNPYAGYAPPSDDLLARAEKALRVSERSGTLDLIRKSLTPLVQVLKTNRVTVPVRRDNVSKTATRPGRTVKADVYEEPVDEMNPDAATEGTHPESDGDEMKPDMPKTAAEAYQLAQLALDMCAIGENGQGDHPKARKAMLAKCEKWRKDADEMKAIGDMVIADMESLKGGKKEAEMPEEPEPVETDDTGAIVDKSGTSLRLKRIAILKAVPWTGKQIKSAKTVVPEGMALVSAKYLKDLEIAAGIE